MPDMVTARNILFVILGICMFIASGAFLVKRANLSTLLRYTIIAAVAAIILGVIYIIYLLFAETVPITSIQDALLIIGVVVMACILISLGGYLGRTIELSRIITGAGILAFLSIIIFLIFMAVLAFSGG